MIDIPEILERLDAALGESASAEETVKIGVHHAVLATVEACAEICMMVASALEEDGSSEHRAGAAGAKTCAEMIIRQAKALEEKTG